MGIDIINIMNDKNIKCTEQQKEAILTNEKSSLVLAVPGSGKTTVIIGKVAKILLNKECRADNILPITFSKASALDMTNRFNSTYGDLNLGSVKFSTIHAFGNWVVSSYNRRFGITKKLISSAEAINAIKTSYTKATKEYLTDDAIENYSSAIGYIKNKMLNDEDIESFAKSSGIDAFIDVYEGYESFKKDRNLYDFDDMLLMALNILKENEVTLNFLKKKYTHIFLDEGQDTSKLQFELIKLLVHKDTVLTIVADDDQSIYAFRGGDSDLLLNINDIFPNTKTFFMERNFRSKKHIINVANTVIKKNKKRYQKHIECSKKEGCKVDIVQCTDTFSQNEYVCKNLKLQEETVILYRNNISLISMASLLKNKNIPFYISNYKPGFFTHWVTQDVLAIINLINNDKDIESFAKVYYKINTYLNKKTIERLKSLKGYNESVFDLLIDYCYLKEHQHDNILHIQSTLKKAKKLIPHRGIEHLMIHLGYYDYLDKKNSDSGTVTSTYKQIVETIIEVAKNAQSYEDVIREMCSLDKVLIDSCNNKESNLRLCTMHSSKGLEFKNVFILHADDGVIPSLPSGNKISKQEKEKLIEEDRRLFFVAITRAKDKLSIITTTRRDGKFIKEVKSAKESINIIKI